MLHNPFYGARSLYQSCFAPRLKIVPNENERPQQNTPERIERQGGVGSNNPPAAAPPRPEPSAATGNGQGGNQDNSNQSSE